MRSLLSILLAVLLFTSTSQRLLAAGLTIQVVEGQGAINNIKRGTAFEPVVEVRDGDGVPLPGAMVTFTLPAMGPSGIFPNGSTTLVSQTDASGRATARGLRPNNVAGQFEIHVTAAFQGQTASMDFTQTNAAPATEKGSGKKWAILLGIVGGAVAAGAVAAAGGSSSPTPSSPTPTPSDPPAGSVTPGTPGFGPPR
jgi:hypothetical protein